MGARPRGLAAVRRGGGVRVLDLPRGPVERLRSGRPRYHPAEPSCSRAIGAVACVRRVILASRSRGTPLSSARRRHLRPRRAGGRRSLVSLREPVVARGRERGRGRVGAAVARRRGRPRGGSRLRRPSGACGGGGQRRRAGGADGGAVLRARGVCGLVAAERRVEHSCARARAPEQRERRGDSGDHRLRMARRHRPAAAAQARGVRRGLGGDRGRVRRGAMGGASWAHRVPRGGAGVLGRRSGAGAAHRHRRPRRHRAPSHLSLDAAGRLLARRAQARHLADRLSVPDWPRLSRQLGTCHWTRSGAAPWPVRLTAIAALADIGLLLIFPLTLRVDYSPAERTLVTSPLDGRFLIGLACLAIWGVLLGRAWRRRRRVEALGLAWIAIAYLPVANLLFPSGVLVAERTLYAPSIGLALALGAWLARLELRRAALVAGLLLLAGGVRSAVRVPVWHDDLSVVVSILGGSPASYRAR